MLLLFLGAGSRSIAAADLNGDMLRLSSLGLLRLSRMHKSTGKRRYSKRKSAGFLGHPLDGWLPSSMMPLGAIIFCELG
jgi:hypothetical protein